MAKKDRELVAAGQQYEVAYFAQKHWVRLADARATLQPAGRSRERANVLAEVSKTR
jgi:hypothetical protein